MRYRITENTPVWLTAAVASLALLAAFFLSTATPAKAWTTGLQTYCFGVTLPGGKGQACRSLWENKVGYITEVHGSGANHSVCVLAWGEGIKMCSGGPLQGVYNASPAAVNPTYGEILNNAAGANKVYSSAVFCVNPGC